MRNDMLYGSLRTPMGNAQKASRQTVEAALSAAELGLRASIRADGRIALAVTGHRAPDRVELLGTISAEAGDRWCFDATGDWPKQLSFQRTH